MTRRGHRRRRVGPERVVAIGTGANDAASAKAIADYLATLKP